jgi:hypothetical protein
MYLSSCVRTGLQRLKRQYAHISALNATHGNRESLQLSTTELADFSLKNVVQFQIIANLLLVVSLELRIEHLGDGHGSLDGSRNVVDILRLDQGLQVVLENLGKVVLKLRSSEVLENFLPVGGIVIASKVRLELSGQDLESGTLSDTVGSYQAEHLAWTRSWQSMELERVGGVTVSDLRVQVCRQVDNRNGLERASVWQPLGRFLI